MIVRSPAGSNSVTARRCSPLEHGVDPDPEGLQFGGARPAEVIVAQDGEEVTAAGEPRDLHRGHADYKAGCPSCSAIADGFNGFVVHLANHDVMLWAVSRAPLAKLQAYKRRMGWTFPWASSFEQRLQLRLRRRVHRGAAARGSIEYNYRRE